MNRRTFFASFLALIGVKPITYYRGFDFGSNEWTPKLTKAQMEIFNAAQFVRANGR